MYKVIRQEKYQAKYTFYSILAQQKDCACWQTLKVKNGVNFLLLGRSVDIMLWMWRYEPATKKPVMLLRVFSSSDLYDRGQSDEIL